MTIRFYKMMDRHLKYGLLLVVGSMTVMGCSSTPSLEFDIAAQSLPPPPNPQQIVASTDRIPGHWVGAVYVARANHTHVLKVQTQNNSSSDQKIQGVVTNLGFNESNLHAGSSVELSADPNAETNTPTLETQCSNDNTTESGRCASISSLSIFFDFDKDTLSPEAQQALDTYAEHNTGPLEIIGYADAVGDSLHNQSLSIARANSVANYLRKLGIADVKAKAGLISSYQGQGFRRAILVSDSDRN